MVKNIFKVLGTAIICILLVAFGVNILFPNFIGQIVGKVEAGIKAGTSASIDLNGDGVVGDTSAAKSTGAEDTLEVGGASEWNGNN